MQTPGGPGTRQYSLRFPDQIFSRFLIRYTLLTFPFYMYSINALHTWVSKSAGGSSQRLSIALFAFDQRLANIISARRSHSHGKTRKEKLDGIGNLLKVMKLDQSKGRS